jgi:pyroglutamyl-peptidase
MARAMTTILVTGFEPFGEYARNPSAELAASLADEPGVRSAVLPVSYERAEREILALIRKHAPVAVLLLGLHPGEALRLERIALNLDDTAAPDNDGEVRVGRRIREDGPVAYWSTLPLTAFARSAEAAGLPLTWSRDAGGFLCNHVFYVAADELARTGRHLPCGLIHVPEAGVAASTLQLGVLRELLSELR